MTRFIDVADIQHLVGTAGAERFVVELAGYIRADFRVFDIDPEATEFVRNMAHVEGLTVIRAASVREDVRGADIVTTVTADQNYATILTPGMIEPGMHINGVGGDCPGKIQ